MGAYANATGNTARPADRSALSCPVVPLLHAAWTGPDRYVPLPEKPTATRRGGLKDRRRASRPVEIEVTLPAWSSVSVLGMQEEELELPSPATSTLTTGHHGRGAAAVLRRPTTDPRSRFLLRARKPAAGSPAVGADTETSSRSENAVLKAAWYGSELLGIAASLLRPAPSSPEGDAAGDAEGGEAEALDRPGVVEAIKEDFARSYFVTGNLTLRAYEEDCEFADPAATGYTEYYFDAESGKVCRHVENWNAPKMALLRQIFRPSRWVWEKR
ncbi:uncharacterized protein C2845_PM15G19350 [Panicum miliaceum]|uniref:Uncharacterized protein n=1 Tax=Panicum miliaceum TaxID=4540 RepID=A0A3L6Q6M7_PANMI|nr:uncharacterized protein C2845_PM15G19350 [Panicum miliaceum]